LSTADHYLRDLGYIIREDALKARERARTARGTEAEQFEAGRALAYYEVVTLMQQQATGFQLPLETICLDNLDADGELL
jgi:hypothetical protein